MIHSIGWVAVTMSALLIREAAMLVRCLLAYRQQRWIVSHAKQVTSEGRGIQITGPDRITIARDPDQLP